MSTAHQLDPFAVPPASDPTFVTDLGALHQARVLIVEPEPDRALAAGAALARMGAQPTVVRTLSNARRELDRETEFEAGLVDFGCDPAGATRLVARLRAGRNPCLSSLIGPALELDVRQSLLLRGAFEVLEHPLRRAALLEAVARLVQGTMQLRSHVTGSIRRSPHVPALESASRRAKFELAGAVSAWTVHRRLTPREAAVLDLIASGLRYEEIGQRLSITTRTVKMHASNIRRKSGARDRYELLRMLLERA